MSDQTPAQSADPRFDLQARLYAFPYHYLPTLDDAGTVSIHKALSWGLDYLTYMSFVTELIQNRLRPQSILDIGCGDGRLLHMLSGIVPQRAGVDLVEDSLRFARAFNPDVTFHLADLGEVPGQFEVVTLIEVLEHIPDDEIAAFVEKTAQRLLPGGWLLASSPTINEPLNRKHYRHYDLVLLRQQLEPHFEIQEYWFLSRRGLRFSFFKKSLQNEFGIIVSGKWRRLIWRLHQRYTYRADSTDGRHIVVLARRRVR